MAEASHPAAAALAADLAAAVRGEVRFGAGDRALYATDASNYRQVPIGVVVPRDADDAEAAVAVCRRHGAPVLARGGGTSLAGQCCNVAVVLDFSKHVRRLVELDPARRLARVEPGLVLDDLRAAAARHGLTFGPDPATHDRCTLGGMIGNNACGIRSLLAGKTVDNVEELAVLTYDGLRLRVGATSEEEVEAIVRAGGRRGEIYRRLRILRDACAGLIRERFPAIPRRVSGYNLDQLLPENGCHVARALVGSEGTCVTLLEATVGLVPSPPGRALLALGYPDVCAAADQVPEVLAHGPIGLEGIDDRLVLALRRKGLHLDGLALLPPGGGWLIAELGGSDQREAVDRARAAMARIGALPHAPALRLVEDPAGQRRLWAARESAVGATASVPGMAHTWPGWEDSAVAPERLGVYLRQLQALCARYRYQHALYGHFGHGCVHARIGFDLASREGVAAFRAFLDEAADLVVSHGGSLSGEHGDGQARGALLPKMFGGELMAAFRDFKSIWDPDGKMNPGKLIDARRPDQDLRLGAGHDPWRPATEFRYPGDHGSLPEALLRCVGVGACRRTTGAMCPSYQVTREEKHSTRGRARLLFELLQRDVIGRRGWREESVFEALGLCLSCKACKEECPVRVDMATYKAEFLAHYYRGRPRPRSAYAFGLIDRWARLGSLAPRLVNLATRTPGLAALVKLAAGVDPRRAIPALAPETFTAWFARREAGKGEGRRVLLWPDTFSNHFHPEVAQAAVEVLEAAGFLVALPPRGLCCGRPLYDQGMLGLARKQLRTILEALSGDLRAGVPVVVLEPSCAATFRDELVNLFPDDEDARRLERQTLLLAELLAREAAGFAPPRLDRPAILHGHCHQKALQGMGCEEALLRRLGLDLAVPEAGCCGMAGAFGFERGERCEVAAACGERALLPAVRRAPAGALIVADGFSCREQIAQGTGRRALHLAQVLRLALRGGRSSFSSR